MLKEKDNLIKQTLYSHLLYKDTTLIKTKILWNLLFNAMLKK